MGIKYTYDGVEHSVAGNSTTLTTQNKICKTNIEIEATGGGNLKDISPITTNGTYNSGANLTVLNSITLNGNAYVPTNINIPNDCDWDIEAKFKTTQALSGTDKSALFGSKGSQYQVLFNQTSNSLYLYMGNEYALDSVSIGTNYTLIKSGANATLNGTSMNNGGSRAVSNAPDLVLFGYVGEEEHITRKFIGEFEYLKFIENGTTTHWFIPVKDENNVIKIFDKVHSKIYDFVGTGITAGTESSETLYSGFASPLVVNVPYPTKWGATLDDMFNTSVSATPTLHNVVIPANKLVPLQRVFRYSTIKSFTVTSPFNSNAQYDYVYAVANTPYLETITIKKGVSWSSSSTNWQYFAYQSTGLKHLSVNGLVGSAANSFSQMFCYCTNLEDVVWYFNPNTPYFQYTNQFNNTFRNCYRLTKITFSGLVSSSGNATNVFNYCFGDCFASFDEDINHFRFPDLTYIGVNDGKSNYANFKYAFTSDDSSYYGKCHLIFPEMYAIYNRNTSATNGHFAYCNALGKIYLPKFTIDGTTGQNIFNNCPYLTEIHFGIENQATVQALNGYASKFGATNATLYFDLVNHITVNGVVYDRSGAEYDYDTSHYSWKNGNDVYYTTNALTPQVGDTVYTKDIHGRYTASQYTITAIA